MASLDPGLRSLVRISAAVAALPASELGPVLRGAVDVADPLEVEEALLQSHLFLGYPAALNALAEWRRASGTSAPHAVDDVGPEGWAERGEKVCRQVYGSAYDGLRENVDALSPEMDRWMVVQGYGRVLGRPGLELGRRECCVVAVLAVLDVPRQLHSHLRGALRCGIAPEQLERVLQVTLAFAGERARASAQETWEVVAASRGHATRLPQLLQQSSSVESRCS